MTSFTRIKTFVIFFSASRLGRRPKRLKESQELEAAQNAKKMEGLHPFPSPIQMAINMSDMQVCCICSRGFSVVICLHCHFSCK